MKKNILLLTVTILSLTACTAQKGPLKGSGKIVNKIFDYKDFDKIELHDLDGKVEIETGQSFSITVAIDDNLENLLNVLVDNGELTIELKGNINNKLYIEETNIAIKITMPELSALKHRGNGNVYVNKLTGNNFTIKNTGNGNVFLNGDIEKLAISSGGNGMVNAEKLLAASVNVNRSGNGNVIINTNNTFNATSSGNGNIINKGNGIADKSSAATGNSSIIDASYKVKPATYPGHEKDTKVASSIFNKTFKTVELKVVYPVKGSYGISIEPGATLKEIFPLGTKIYKDGNNKKILFEITPGNRETLLVIE